MSKVEVINLQIPGSKGLLLFDDDGEECHDTLVFPENSTPHIGTYPLIPSTQVGVDINTLSELRAYLEGKGGSKGTRPYDLLAKLPEERNE